MTSKAALLDIDEKTLQSWENICVPDIDLFFFSSVNEIKKYLPSNAFIIPRKEFNDHNSYRTIDIINSYQLWNISKGANYVCVAPREFFPAIDRPKRSEILHIQKELNRGLIYEWELFEPIFKSQPNQQQTEIWEMIESYMIQDEKLFIAFQKDMWGTLPKIFKREILMKIAELYSDQISEVSLEIVAPYPNIHHYMNRYPAINGPNCFAATLAAATEDEQLSEWIINQWVHPETFTLGIEMRGYKEEKDMMDDLNPQDIVVWHDQNENIIHASFHLGQGWFFNKNGQTFFNSWQVVRQEHLVGNWGSVNTIIYR